MDYGVGSRRAIIVAIIVGSVFLVTAGAALAAGSTDLDLSSGARSAPVSNELAGASISAVISETISETVPMTGGNMIAGYIAALFEVPISDVVTFHSDGYGFGELAIAYALAQEGGLTVQEILDMKESGMGLGEIAAYLGLPPGNSDRNLGRIVSGRVVPSGTVPAGAQRLAERLGADPEEVSALLEEGASYGAVAAAYKLAGQYEGVTPDELLDRRLAGESWGKIKKDLAAAASSVTTTSQNGPPDHAGPPADKGSQGHGSKSDHGGKPDNAGPKEHNNKKNK
jgi:hypothetical protein